ncbi:MAG: cation:proton antiporter [Actinomycetota bacterium]|nr:cation:proton antiporter [Actinomycetota bacterium]
MTLTELAVTIAVLGALGLVARRLGLSAIPAYLLAGLLLGPNEPEQLALIQQENEVTDFVAQLGIVFLLFFLGLEFSLSRATRTGRHVVLGGAVDLAANFGLGLLVGVAAFGFSFAALVLAACVFVSSSAIAVKGLIDFRRLGDDETDLVLAILVVEDIVVAFMLGFAAAGGGEASDTLILVAKALVFITAGLAVSRWLSGPIDRALDRLSLEFFLLAVFGILIGSAALADELGLSAAIGALMAGIVLSETSVRDQVEDRFFSFRDIFAALFFFVFGLSIDLGAIGDVGLIVALAVALTLVGKVGGGLIAGRLGGFTNRQSLNAGVALVAHGEFTIILAQIASKNPLLGPDQQTDLVAFAGLYVLATATIGIVLMKESKRLGRMVFRPPKILEEA